MSEFNHLKNLCEFLDNAANFEHELFDADIEQGFAAADDPMYKYDEAAGREAFAEHIFNLLVEDGADVDEEMASRLTDKLVEAFYVVSDKHRK